MEKINHNFKKKFGQNFLTDNNIIVNTVSSVLLQEDDLVIEIGPGSGMLTKEILKKCRVLAYEIDTDLVDTLSNIPNNEKLTIIWDDFLKRDVVKDIEKFRYNKLYIIAPPITKCSSSSSIYCCNSSNECTTFTLSESIIKSGFLLNIMCILSGKIPPNDSNVFLPIIIVCPVVLSLNLLKSSGMCHNK